MKIVNQTAKEDIDCGRLVMSVQFEPGELVGRTAGFLRDVGFKGIPDNIPNCAVMGHDGVFDWIEMKISYKVEM